MAYHASVRRFVARVGTGLLLLTLALMASTGAQAAVLGPAVGANVPSVAQVQGSSSPAALSPSTIAQVAQHAHGSSLTNAPGVAAHVLRAAPTHPALGSVPAGIFSTPIQVSTTTTTDQNGGPVFAWSTNPSTVSDASGYVWTAWAANVSGRWSIFFAFSSSDGASFSTPVQLDSGATTQDTGPSLAVHGSGATARDVWINPPPIPLTTAEMDHVFDLPYARSPHPSYADETGGHDGPTKIPAWEMIRFSVNIMRGCFGGCTFCSITEHEGRIIQSRSEDSVIREIEEIRDKVPGFTGVVSDLGGPTANMYRIGCKSPAIEAACRKPSCVYPGICPNLNTDHGPLIHLYRRARALRGIKKILIGSGLRYDLAIKSP